MLNILYDSFLQTFVFSPLMGVLFASIFAGTAHSPSPQAPRTIIRTREIYVERLRFQRPKTQNDGDGKEVFGLALILVFILWKYVQIAPIIHNYIAIGLSIAISFCVTSFLISLYKGQFTDPDWAVRISIPIFVLIFCVYLLLLASKSIDPELIERARVTNAFQFYFHELDKGSRNQLITHVIGITCLILVGLLSWLTQIHFLALMNQREDSVFYGFWCWLTNKTFRFSGIGMSVLLVIISITSLLLINGTITEWTGNG